MKREYRPVKPAIELIRRIGSGSALAKIGMTLFVLLFVPLLATSLVIYRSSAQVIERAAAEEIAGRLGEVREAVDTINREIELIVVSYAANRNVTDFLSQTVYEFQNWTMINTVRSIQESLALIARPYIRAISIYSERNDYVISSTYGRRYSRDPAVGWHERFLAERSERGFLSWSPPSERDGTDVYEYFAPLPLYSSTGVRGSVLISLDTPELFRMLRIEGLESLGDVTIVTDEQRVFYATEGDRIGQTVYDGETRLSGSRTQSIELAGQSGWVVSVRPHGRLMESQKARLLQRLILGLAGTLIVSIAITTVLASRLYSPVGHLVTLIEQQGHDRIPPTAENGPGRHHRHNEYEYIAQNVLSSMEANASLSGDLTRALSLFKEYQTKALQSQINPHFLLNTLQVINWEAIELSGGENRVTELLRSLSELLEISMDIDNAVVPLRTELRHLERYCEIMQTRYRNLFSVDIRVDGELLDHLVVKMSLQPLVENAIYHGLKPRDTAGSISVTAVRQPRLFRLVVEDDGVGLSASRLSELNALLKSDPYAAGAAMGARSGSSAGIDGSGAGSTQSIGIANVHHRTRTLFGDRYGVRLMARPGGGVRAVLTLPYQIDQETTRNSAPRRSRPAHPPTPSRSGP